MTAPVAPRCGRCGATAPYGFGPPLGFPDRGTLHACEAHRDAAETRWRAIYEVAA